MNIKNLVCVAVLLAGVPGISYASCPHDPNCLNNPHGAGSPYKPDGLLNPHSQ